MRVSLHPLRPDDRQLLIEAQWRSDPGPGKAGRGEPLFAEELPVDQRIVEHLELGPVGEVHLAERHEELPQFRLQARGERERGRVSLLDLDPIPVDAQEGVVAEVGVDRALDADLDLPQLVPLAVLERRFLGAQVDEEVRDAAGGVEDPLRRPPG
jgi:hypothetical protein